MQLVFGGGRGFRYSGVSGRRGTGCLRVSALRAWGLEQHVDTEALENMEKRPARNFPARASSLRIVLSIKGFSVPKKDKSMPKQYGNPEPPSLNHRS